MFVVLAEFRTVVFLIEKNDLWVGLFDVFPEPNGSWLVLHHFKFFKTSERLGGKGTRKPVQEDIRKTLSYSNRGRVFFWLSGFCGRMDFLIYIFFHKKVLVLFFAQKSQDCGIFIFCESGVMTVF